MRLDYRWLGLVLVLALESACGELPPLLSGHCMEFVHHGSGKRSYTTTYVDRKQIGPDEEERLLLLDPTSAPHHRRFHIYDKVGMGALFGGVLFGIASVGLAIVTHHDAVGVAGFPVGAAIAISGAGLLGASAREQHLAIERYNEHADETGVCGEPPPTGTLDPVGVHPVD